MVGVEKKKLIDLFKKKETTETTKPTIKPTAGSRASTSKPTIKPTAKAGAGSGSLSDELTKDKVDAFIEKREALSEAELKKQKEFLHTKTHQDLINAVYKVAEELKVEGGSQYAARIGLGHSLMTAARSTTARRSMKLRVLISRTRLR